MKYKRFTILITPEERKSTKGLAKLSGKSISEYGGEIFRETLKGRLHLASMIPKGAHLMEEQKGVVNAY